VDRPRSPPPFDSGSEREGSEWNTPMYHRH
jgi:hypothetical protein